MRDTARELADGLQLLRLPELFITVAQRLLRLFALAHVAGSTLDADNLPVVEDWPTINFQRNASAIFRQNLQLVCGLLPAKNLLGFHLMHLLFVLWRDDIINIHSQSFFQRISGDLLACLVQ